MSSENEFEHEDMEFDHEGTRRLLRMSAVTPAPAGLEQKIMLSVMAAGKQRKSRRQVLASWLRFIAVVGVVTALGRLVGPQGSVKEIATGIGRTTEDYGQVRDWMLHNSYLFVAPFVLWLVIKVWRGSRDYESAAR